jgi:serine protein kinase
MAQINEFLDGIREESEALSWEGTFREYLEMAIANPSLARLSHIRIYDMLQWAGAGSSDGETVNYPIFDNLFGARRTIQRLTQIFRAASQIPEERRRILLLMGPPGSGKSSLVNALKRGLERYSRTDEGALYAIAGCPMQEEPMHLVPEQRRAELKEAYGLHVEGDLCPRCRDTLRNDYDGDIAAVKVRRVVFGESEGVGIGSFVATSPQGQNLDRLIGSVNLDKLADDRLEGAGRAFRMDGELQAANRGIMEFIQIFRSDDRFLTVVLGVTQEQLIKLGSFGSVYADETIIAHSNEAEYVNFGSNKESEALLDRLIMLKAPYTLERSEEVKIYQKLLSDAPFSQVHVSPITLPVVASLAVLSRLDLPKRAGRDYLRKRMEMFDGRAFPNFARGRQDALEEEEDSNEGMFGLSPRFIINRLADAISRGPACLGPVAALENLVEGFEERAGVAKDDMERLPALLPEAIESYKELALRQMQRAATDKFEERAQLEAESYLRRLEDLLSEEGGGAPHKTRQDDRALRPLERAISVPDSRREDFRREVLQAHRRIASRGVLTSYRDIPLLAAALEELLLPSLKDVSVMLRNNKKQLHLRETISRRLMDDYGYCSECAEEIIVFASGALRGRMPVSVKNGRLVHK